MSASSAVRPYFCLIAFADFTHVIAHQCRMKAEELVGEVLREVQLRNGIRAYQL